MPAKILIACIIAAVLVIFPPSWGAMDIQKRGDAEFLGRFSRLFQSLSRKALPAVVAISTIKPVDPRHLSLFFSPFLPEPEDELPNNPKTMGIGSGIIVRPDGTILTNHHVIENADHLMVTLDEHHRYRARLIGSDPKTDLAVIRLEPKAIYPGPLHPPITGLPTLTFAKNTEVNVGDWAMAVGSPFGLTRSVSLGIISAIGRGQLGVLDIEDFLQTDAAINPGSSGGPLLNTQGEVIGVSSAIFSQNGAFSGIGFAIPSHIASEVADQLIESGRVRRGWAGILAQDLSEDLSEYFLPGVENGALIARIAPGGPADKAEFRPGDLIRKFGPDAVENARHLKKLVSKARTGTPMMVEIVRDHKPIVATLQVQDEPHRRIRAGSIPPVRAQQKQSNLPPLGLVVEDIPREIIQFLDGAVKQGVMVVGVYPGSISFDAGLFAGDIILNINQKELRGTKDYQQLVRSFPSGSLNVFYIQRGADDRLFVPIRKD